MSLACLRMTWHHDIAQLAVGHFLASARGRTAFEICTMRRVAVKRPTFGATVWALGCERHSRADVPEGATVHTFYWFKR